MSWSFEANVESIVRTTSLSMGSEAALVTARSPWSGEEVEFKIATAQTMKIGDRIHVMVSLDNDDT